LCTLWLLALAIGPCVEGAAHAQHVLVGVPDGCGSQAELQAALRRMLGTAAVHVRGELRIAGPDPSAQYRLSVRSDDDARELQSADCRTLFRSASVMLASATREPNDPGTAADVASPSALDDGLGGSAALGGGAVLGLVPGAAFQLELQGQLRSQRFGITFALLYVPPNEVSGGEPFGAALSALGGQIAGTIDLASFARFSSGMSLRHFTAVGRGNAATRAASAWSTAAVLELALRLPAASPLICELALAADWALLRPSFEFAHGPRVFRVAPVAGILLARLGWNFH
jgi:hypothetical protein